jgi:hypothetical protein
MLESLSKEQEALMHTTANEWISLFNDTKRIDEAAFEEGIAWVYTELLKLPAPKVVYCESWISAVRTIYAMKNDIDVAKINEVEMPSSELSKIFSEYSNYTNTYSNFGWVSYYDYFEKIGILDNDMFKKYKKLIKAGAFQVYEYEHYVFAVQPPTVMLRNENGELNSITDKAFEWSDGNGFYFINGFSISDELFAKLKNRTLTVSEFLNEDNEEVKSAIVSYIQQADGDEGIYRFFSENLTEVDTFVDKKADIYLDGTTRGMNIGVYTLFKGNINNVDIAYVRCYCPSTDRMFFLGVEPKHTNAKDAIASLYQVPKLLKSKIKTISRQGEKFSTVFDEETTKLLKNGLISKSDLSDYVSISGDEYFEKMTYEY